MTASSSSLRRHLRYCSLATQDTELVEVRAVLRHGAIIGSWFPAPLDGALAAAERRRRLGAGYGAVVDHHSEALPLASTARGRVGTRFLSSKRWVWAASCAWWEGGDEAPRDTRWLHKRAWSEARAHRVGVGAAQTPANPDVGRYKPERIPAAAVMAPELAWWCLGDPERIAALLADVPAIGERRGSGEGVVARWKVTALGAPDWGRVLWAPDGRVARPIPARHAEPLGLAGCDTLTVDAYRPPYWRPPITETGRRAPQEVIAPWVTRPERWAP